MVPIRLLLLVLAGVLALLGAGASRAYAPTPAPLGSELAVAQAEPIAEAARELTFPVRPAEPPAPEVVQLQNDLARIIAGPGWTKAHYGVLVISLARGDTLFSQNPDLPLAPASNLKLYSTAAALYYLGPGFRYSTYALADGEIRDGTLEGDLVLYGTGDPAISSRMLPGALSPLRALADSLKARGVTEVRGDLIGDGSYFDDRWIAEGWREEYRLDSYSAPIGALSFAENIVSIRVAPAAVGQAAEVRTTPSTAGLLVQNQVRTTSTGSSSVRFAYDPEGLRIEGQIASGHPGVARTVTVVDPANFAAAAFRTVLEQAGIRVLGTVRTIRDAADSPVHRTAGSVPGATRTAPPRVLGTHLSPTLAEIALVTNHVSQNLFADALFKTAGRVALGHGSFSAGAHAVQYFLQCEEPIDFTGIEIVDGSGLSPLNRVTARSTVHLLALMTRSDLWEVFRSSLPEAASPEGGAHSLRGRMGGTPAARNLRAKTGTINNVSSLSGYVTSANGELLAFSILGNDVPSTWQAKRIEDAIGVRLARFTRPAVSEPAVAEVPEHPAAAGSPVLELPADASRSEADASTRPEEGAAPSLSRSDAAGQAGPARTHRVGRGDTLDGIARRYGSTVAELQRLNPGLEARRLQLGAIIKLPS